MWGLDLISHKRVGTGWPWGSGSPGCVLGGGGMRDLLYCLPPSQAPGSWSRQEAQSTDGDCASLSKESARQPGGPGRLENQNCFEGESQDKSLRPPHPARVGEEFGEHTSCLKLTLNFGLELGARR